MNIKGIVLAGGSGTRLRPLTNGTSKQLLPVYDKPMIFYAISVLMLASIRDVLIITTEAELAQFKRLLGTGADFGVNFHFATQKEPRGIADAFLVGEQFISNSRVALVLGDNLFFGQGLSDSLSRAACRQSGATIFAYQVADARRFGVVEVSPDMKVLSLEEKPKSPKSKLAVTGLYFYDQRVVEFAKMLEPSERGEIEITDLNKLYLAHSSIDVEVLGRGFTWLDAGTHASLLDASLFVQTIQERQGLMIACLQEIAYRKGWLNAQQIEGQLSSLGDNGYAKYLRELIAL